MSRSKYLKVAKESDSLLLIWVMIFISALFSSMSLFPRSVTASGRCVCYHLIVGQCQHRPRAEVTLSVWLLVGDNTDQGQKELQTVHYNIFPFIAQEQRLPVQTSCRKKFYPVVHVILSIQLRQWLGVSPTTCCYLLPSVGSVPTPTKGRTLVRRRLCLAFGRDLKPSPCPAT